MDTWHYLPRSTITPFVFKNTITLFILPPILEARKASVVLPVGPTTVNALIIETASLD
jgi:hypothetical protein